MKSLITPKKILSLDPSGTPYYGFVRIGQGKYVIADIHPGKGYHAIIHIGIARVASRKQFFYEIYQQLKGIFEQVSEHH